MKKKLLYNKNDPKLQILIIFKVSWSLKAHVYNRVEQRSIWKSPLFYVIMATTLPQNISLLLEVSPIRGGMQGAHKEQDHL